MHCRSIHRLFSANYWTHCCAVPLASKTEWIRDPTRYLSIENVNYWPVWNPFHSMSNNCPANHLLRTISAEAEHFAKQPTDHLAVQIPHWPSVRTGIQPVIALWIKLTTTISLKSLFTSIRFCNNNCSNSMSCVAACWLAMSCCKGAICRVTSQDQFLQYGNLLLLDPRLTLGRRYSSQCFCFTNGLECWNKRNMKI